MKYNKTPKSALTKSQKNAIKNRRPSRSLAEIDKERMLDSSGELRHERVFNAFEWIPLHERPSAYHWLPKPYFPYKEQRKPHLWLSGGQSCWFVNDSDDTLDYVCSLSGGYASTDNDIIPISSDKIRYKYEQVQPHEAVLVESFDSLFDSDFIFQVSILIQSPTYGRLELTSETGKGSIPESLFIWNTGEYVKNASIKKLDTE